MSEQADSAPAVGPAVAEIRALVQAGKASLEQGDIDGALTRFEAVIQRFPQSCEGHNNLGALYAALGHFAKAEPCFTRVLALLPGNPNVLYNRGVARVRLGAWDDAIADFTAALQAVPNDADCWNNLGVAHYLKGDYAAAAANLRKALQLGPSYENAALNLVDVEIAAGRRSEAIRVCERFLQANQADEVRHKLADLLRDEAQELLARAGTTLESCLREQPSDAAARDQLGRLLQAQEALAGEVASAS